MQNFRGVALAIFMASFASIAGAADPSQVSIPKTDKPNGAITIGANSLARSMKSVDGDLRAGRPDEAVKKLMNSAQANKSPFDVAAAMQIRLTYLVSSKDPKATMARAMEISRSDEAMQRGARMMYEFATGGSLEAMYQMALFYDAGIGVAPDRNLSSAWMMHAAQRGHPQAKQLVDMVAHGHTAEERKELGF